MASPLARVNVRADAWELIWSFVHRTLVVNLGLAVAGLPLMLALSLVAEPWDYPQFFGLLALPLGPAVAAAFGYLANDDARPPLKVLVSEWRLSARRSLLVSVVVLALAGVLLTDLHVLVTHQQAVVLVPLLATLLFLVLSAALLALMLTATNVTLSHGAMLRAAVYGTVRMVPLSLLSLAVLAGALVIVSQVPLAGLVTVPGCALWVVFTNSRIQLAKVGSDHGKGADGVASPLAGDRSR